jgi:hypothetical protein
MPVKAGEKKHERSASTLKQTRLSRAESAAVSAASNPKNKGVRTF